MRIPDTCSGERKRKRRKIEKEKMKFDHIQGYGKNERIKLPKIYMNYVLVTKNRNVSPMFHHGRQLATLPVEKIAAGPRQHSNSWFRDRSGSRTIFLFFSRLLREEG
jgi:hypothetical protein